MLIDTIRVLDYRSIEDVGPLHLGPATVISGRNNAGKSSLIRAVCHLQAGTMLEKDDIRLGSSQAQVLAEPATRLQQYLRALNPNLPHSSRLSIFATWDGLGSNNIRVTWNEGKAENPLQIPRTRAHSAIVPVLSGRRVSSYEQTVSLESGQNVSVSDRELTSRIFGLSSGQHREGEIFRSMCSKVLGLNIATFLSDSGQEPGLALSADAGISVSRMGQGISSTLKLLSELCHPRPRLYCLEEPENDLHPEALRQLLEIIRAAVTDGNQFLVSTHSSQVLRALGSIEGSYLYEASMSYGGDGVPQTSYMEVNGHHARAELLATLGYEIAVPHGWLLLEESTAEQLLSEFLIPRFAPRLGALRTVSARGVDRLARSADDYVRLGTYAHLGAAKERLWVLLDGDQPGLNVARQLRDPSASSPLIPNQIRTIGYDNLEAIYPPRFADQVASIQELRGKPKAEAKWKLVRQVLDWCANEPDVAEVEFRDSASRLVQALVEMENEYDQLPDLKFV